MSLQFTIVENMKLVSLPFLKSCHSLLLCWFVVVSGMKEASSKDTVYSAVYVLHRSMKYAV